MLCLKMNINVMVAIILDYAKFNVNVRKYFIVLRSVGTKMNIIINLNAQN